MNYSKLFSADTKGFLSSPVRDIFNKVDLSSIYSLAGGYPESSTFPLRSIPSMCEKVIERYGAKTLQYGPTRGVMELREVISTRYGVAVENIHITTSSQQGIDMCNRIMLDPGDIVLTFNPCFLGALQSFSSYRAKVLALSGLENYSESDKTIICGLKEEDLQKAKLCYVIPDFQNPSGVTMSLELRQKLCKLAKRFGFIIVEDSPYRDLRYSGQSIETIYELAPEQTLHLCSFSKIFAPGFRLGWMFGPEEILEQIYRCKQSLDLCPPVLDQYLAAEWMESGALDIAIAKSIELYKSKRDLLISLLEQYMPDGVSWTHPDGGLFLFLTLPSHIDTVKLYDSALNAGVAYVAGSFFYTDGSHANTMRLCFSYLEAEKMEAGVKILSDVITKAL